MISRRMFLASGAAVALAPAATPKRIAALTTVYRHRSHADVIIGKYLEGFNQDGKAPGPASKLVSMYVAQFPDNDMARDKARQHGVPIHRTIYEALTLGTGKLAVDGVLFVGEHGEYPWNDKEQHLYPRFEFFLEITDTFRQTSQTAPVFNDKHLSYSWIKARRMVEISEQMGFPMMAGSSLPVTHRDPDVDVPLGSPINKAVAVFYGGLDSYGFHLLESMQCLAERRRGGETGVRAVQCLEHQAVWDYLDRTSWAQRLLEKALARSKTLKTGRLQDLVKEPSVYLVDYADGLQGAAFRLNGAVGDATAAVDIEGRGEPLSTLMWSERGAPSRHFACLVQHVEKMFQTGVPAYPVQRTLLTSGILDVALESRFQGHKRLETPYLKVRYEAPKQSQYCKGPPPWA